MSDRRAKSRARRKAGRFCYRAELDEVWAEAWVGELGFDSSNVGASLATIVTRLMTATCRNVEFARMLIKVLEDEAHASLKDD